VISASGEITSGVRTWKEIVAPVSGEREGANSLGAIIKDDVLLTATRNVHVSYQPSVHKFYSLQAIAKLCL
jgi:hypothetical protein